jgi:hypothetical protein
MGVDASNKTSSLPVDHDPPCMVCDVALPGDVGMPGPKGERGAPGVEGTPAPNTFNGTTGAIGAIGPKYDKPTIINNIFSVALLVQPE